MGHYVILILLSLSYVRCDDNFSVIHGRIERDYFVEDLFTPVQQAHFQRSIFPTFKRCEAVDPVRANRSILDNRTSTWSTTLSVFVFPSKEIITDGGRKLLEKAYNEDPQYMKARFGVLAFFLLAILMALISALYIPIAGSILFWMCEIIYHLLTNRWFRKAGRKFLILKELRRRRNELRLLKYAEVKRTPPKPKFRMPKFFRDHSDEDIPEELKGPHGNVFGGSDSDDFDVEEAYQEIQDLEKTNLEAMVAKLNADRRAAEEAISKIAEDEAKMDAMLKSKKGKKGKKNHKSRTGTSNASKIGLPLKSEINKKPNKKSSKKKLAKKKPKKK